MPKRSKLLEDDISDSASDGSDVDAPNDFGDLPEQDQDEARRILSRKRKRGHDKEDALYGIWANERPATQGERQKNNRAPRFVVSNKVASEQDFDAQPAVDNLALDDDHGDDDDMDESDDDEEDDEDGSMPDAQVQETALPLSQDDQLPASRPGLGSATNASSLPTRGGIGSNAMPRGGIGSFLPTNNTQPQSADSSTARQPRSFLSSKPSSAQNSPRPATPLTAEEKRHFAKLESQGGMGFKLLSKMGWSAGTGLGSAQEGRINPVDQQLRPAKMGIGHGGFKEKTKQSRLEAVRRGEQVSDEEDDADSRKKNRNKLLKQAAKEERNEAWKASPASRARKNKVEHKSYEEILKEATEAGQSVEAGIGQIIDISGAELPSLASSLSLNVPVPTSDTERLPELRHNLRLLVDTCEGELLALAKEGQAVQEKRKWVGGQERKAVAALHEEQSRIDRLQEVIGLVAEISALTKKASNASDLFQSVESQFEQLATNYTRQEFKLYGLDQVVVAAIAPPLRVVWSDWEPLQDPSLFARELSRLKRVLVPEAEPNPEDMQMDTFAHILHKPSTSLAAEMTPYEALMWTYWLPRVRSAINNAWHPSDPQPAIQLFSAWRPILPKFIADNILDQLILPKVRTAMSEWGPRTSDYTLHGVVFPWLQFAGLRMEEILQDAKRRLKSWLKNWKARDGVPAGFDMWRNVHESSEWDSLMLKTVLPALGTLLREKFFVNPRNQKMDPLQSALLWKPYLRPAMVDQLFELEFFPKWLDALYIWLTGSNPDYDQVQQWYSWWKDEWFPKDIASLPGSRNGFAKGIQLMQDALSLGDDAQYRLSRPVLRPVGRNEVPGAPRVANKDEVAYKKLHQLATETSFRSIVEDMAAENNLIFMSTGKAHSRTGQPLFRISKTMDAKKSGVLVYLQDDIVWADEGSDEWSPISVDELIKRAS